MGSIRRTTAGGVLAALLLGLLVLVGGTATATAAAPVAVPSATFEDVGRALRSDPLYVDPKSQVTLTPSQQLQLRTAISGAGSPLYIALLPQQALTAAGGSPDAVIDRVRRAVGLPGTYAIMIGSSNSSYGFQARSTLGSVGPVATAAYQENLGDPAGTLLQFTDSVAEMAAVGELSGGVTVPGPGDGSLSDSTSSASSAASSGSAVGALAVLGGVLLVGGGATAGLVAYGRKKSRQRNAAAVAAVRRTLEEDITAFGEALDQLEVDMSDPRLGDEGRADLQEALDSYEGAKAAAAAMTSPEQASAVTSALDDGRWRLACVQARLAGTALPERRPPCFFDPRHGPSVKDVPFVPSQGAAVRDVPACQACATAVETGQMPDYRVTQSSTGTQPYWNSGSEYAGYTQGYYRSNTDLMSTIFMATMIGSMFSHSHAYYPQGGYGDGASYQGGDQAGTGSGGGGWGDSGGSSGSGGWFGDSGGGGWGDFGGGGGDSGGGW